MRATLVLLALALGFAPPAFALWGVKARACPRLEEKLVQMELSGVSPTAPRLRRVRERFTNRCVALNEIQVLGTHNSYHIQPRQQLLNLLLIFDPAFQAWEYTHLPLAEQFSTQGIRQIELDVFADPPPGGLYDLRRALILINQDPDSGLPEMEQPGFKVLHVQDVDFETTCPTFVQCLRAIKAWSDANRRHLPITVLVEAKDDPIPDPVNLGFTVPVPIDTAEFDALDAEIRSVFPRRRLVTPDDVRRGRPTLEEAVLTLGWPRLDAVRGKVLFLLDNGGAKRAAYRAGRPSLEGRVLFTNSVPGDADGAFVKLNNPFDPNIPNVVAAGYLVRTRADADTVEARTGDTAPRDSAIASGAQFVSTDYPVPNPSFGTGYFVELPGGMPARCNPVNAPAGCRAEGLERLR